MRRVFAGLLLTGSLLGVADRLLLSPPPVALAQTQSADGLFYTYKGQRIPLNLRQDAIAVTFKSGGSRGGLGGQPLYRQLQNVLQSGSRGIGAPKVAVSPLGDDLAVVNMVTPTNNQTVVQQIQKQPYVQDTLPVLTRGDRQEVIILPNEIILSFQSGLTDAQKQAILTRQQLELIRPLRFSRDRYLVKSTTASGTALLEVTNRLSQVKGIESAAPNFIQSLPDQSRQRAVNQARKLPLDQPFEPLTKQLDAAPDSSRAIAPQSNLLGLQWHLYSPPLKQCSRQASTDIDTLKKCLSQKTSTMLTASSRSDLHATDAWKQGNGGQGVVVAVIDSLIEWDHPNLAQSLYTVQSPHKCPGEVHGWDFTVAKAVRTSDPCKVGDPDTRINKAELALLTPIFQDTFQLSNTALLRKYPDKAAEIRQANPEDSEAEIARTLRYMIRTYEIGSEFHGTWVSGVIAAQPDQGEGVVGVAPNAKILPVRAMGLNGRFVPSSYMEAIAYAADRGATVINISLGGRLPSEGEEAVISDVLKQHPNLVIVASSGNEDQSQVSYPAAIPGVVAVGATNVAGNRAPYSNYGARLGVVAPGGDLTANLWGGIPSTGGTWLPEFWRGLDEPAQRWGPVLDPKGDYWWVEGTSFSSPAVAGVVALMQGEDPQHRLTRDRLVSILKRTASYEGLSVSDAEMQRYRSQIKRGKLASSVSPQQYFFGSGLVNADVAVQQVKQAIAQLP